MAFIDLNHVSVSFPVFNARSRSIKTTLLQSGAGGLLNAQESGFVQIQALRDVSLQARDGERVGLIGPNGAGKTTLLRVLAGIYEPALGAVHVEGRVSPLFDLHLGMDPEATGYENIYLRGLFLGLSYREIRKRIPEIREFTELGEYLSMPVRTYSDGMRLRLAFAACTSFRPDILLMDEGILAGDAKFIEKASMRLDRFIQGASIFVLASHSEQLIQRFCTRAVLLDAGRVLWSDTPQTIFDLYRQRITGEPMGKRLYEVGGRGYLVQTSWDRFSMDGVFSTDGSYEAWTHGVLERALRGPERPYCVDIGANIGLVTLACKSFAPQARIYAVEALPPTVELLTKNLEANDVDDVTVIRKALSDRPGKLDVVLPEDEGLGRVHVTESRPTQDPLRHCSVEATTLDQLVAEHRIPQIDLLKIDVEGWETQVIRGGQRSIRELRPLSLVEFNVASDAPEIQERSFSLFQELASMFDSIWWINRLTKRLTPLRSYAQLRSLMLTGHLVEDLVCGFRDKHAALLQDLVDPISHYATYHCAHDLQTEAGLLSFLQVYPDCWSHENSAAVVAQVSHPVLLKFNLLWYPEIGGESNTVWLFKNDEVDRLVITEKPKPVTCAIQPGDSLFFWCARVREARSVWQNDDPRVIGFNIEVLDVVPLAD